MDGFVDNIKDKLDLWAQNKSVIQLQCKAKSPDTNR